VTTIEGLAPSGSLPPGSRLLDATAFQGGYWGAGMIMTVAAPMRCRRRNLPHYLRAISDGRLRSIAML